MLARSASIVCSGVFALSGSCVASDIFDRCAVMLHSLSFASTCRAAALLCVGQSVCYTLYRGSCKGFVITILLFSLLVRLSMPATDADSSEYTCGAPRHPAGRFRG